MARVAMGVNSQLSSWIPRAERYRRQRKKEIADAVRERAAADKASKTRTWNETQIKEHVDAELAIWDALIESLRLVRDDMSTIISFAQSTMRWMQTEEMTGNLQI
jgi:hypothetical protein